jgi:protein-disulfide isomerase
MKSRFSFILIACVIVFGAILFISKKDASAPNSGNNSDGQPTNHVRGENKKNVTLTEYGDFECPACGGYYPVVEQVVEKYKADIQFQFVNFPLTQIHPNAMLAHRSAEAASNQGKFWEMYNLLYQNQSTWTSLTPAQAEAAFRSYAESLELDMTKFETDQKSQATNSIINADVSKGKGLGITSTPSFFVDGKKIENPKDLEAFSKVIEDAIKAKQ